MLNERIIVVLLIMLMIAGPYLAIHTLFQIVDEALANPLTGVEVEVSGLCGPLLVGLGYTDDGIVVGIENIGNETVVVKGLGIGSPTSLLPKIYSIDRNVVVHPQEKREYYIAWDDLGPLYRDGDRVMLVIGITIGVNGVNRAFCEFK